jgi:hypothetical protein
LLQKFIMNTSGEGSHIPMSAMDEIRLREIDQTAANMLAAGIQG